MSQIRILRDFVRTITEIADENPTEEQMLRASGPLMSDLLKGDTWLPSAYAQPNPERYCQYLLHCDAKERFSLVSFVWAPGQETPIHDHTVWGILGVLRGSEVSQRYVQQDGVMQADGPLEFLESGATDLVSPRLGDIHRVRNGSNARPSISIHLYGGNIGAINRHAFTPEGTAKTFRSGYSAETTPNIWS